MNGCKLRVLLAALFVLGFSVLASGSAAAASFSAQNVGSSTINATSTNNQITITINNTDSSANITVVNVTLYSFGYVTGTASTTATANDFSNTTANLSWTNSSAAGFIAANGGVQNFTFNVNAPANAGSYNLMITVKDTAGVSNSTNITYSVVDPPNYAITFSALSPLNMSLSTNLIQNLSYIIGITNNGNLIEVYNLSVVNCSNISQQGVGILNYSAITLNASEIKAVQLNVSNSTSGFYSSCIMARHYNGTVDTSNVTSLQNLVLLNSSFYPDINVTNIIWTSTVGQNPFAGGNITVNATLNNSGHFNFSGSIGVYLLWDGVAVNTTVTVPNTSLGNGTPYNVSFSNITGIANGLHNLTVWADALASVAELNEANNNLTTQVFVGYNITILNVTGYNVTGSANNATSYSNVTLNVSVRYPNSTLVLGLTIANFTSASDYYNGAANNAPTISGVAGSGFYTLNITTYSTLDALNTQPGVHNISVNATGNLGNNNYSGGSTDNGYYYLIVPRLVVTVTPAYYTKPMETGQTVTVNIANTGNDTFYNVNITSWDDGGADILIGSIASGCNYNITPGSSYNCNLNSVRSIDISGEGDQSVNIVVDVSGIYPYGGRTYTTSGISSTITITDTSTTTTTTTSGGGSSSRKCTSDASCLTNETCSSSKICVGISCTGGEVVNHVCIPASQKINITDYASSLTAVSGGTASTKVTVENSGGTTLSAKLEVTINNVTVTVSPASYSLDAGESYEFTVNFTVPNSTVIGNFSGSFKAYVSTSTSTYDRKSFSFIVLPKEETKSMINVSYQNLSAAFSLLVLKFDQMKASGMYNESVLSAVQDLINAANSTLLEMKAAVESSDYVSAQSLISQVNTSINSAQSRMDNAQLTGSQILGFAQGMWFWVAIVVIIVFVLGFFIYMFYPSGKPGSQGYRPEKGFTHPEAGKGEGIGAKIKKAFKRKKKAPQTTTTDFARSMTATLPDESHYETFHYSEGYKKERSYGYEYGSAGGVKGFFRRLKRRKPEKLPQMHLDQFSKPVTEQEEETAGQASS